MQKFLVLYMAPAAGLEAWMKTDPEIRKPLEEKMMKDWDEWMAAHRNYFVGETAGVGKTKRVTELVIEDIKNDIMLHDIIEAESHEAAAALFAKHPHFQIPNAWIEIMVLNSISGK